MELTAAHFGVSVAKLNELLASARAKMADVRKTRPRPHLDTKMLASWNGKRAVNDNRGVTRVHVFVACQEKAAITYEGLFHRNAE